MNMDNPMSEEQQIIAGCRREEAWAQKKLYEKYAPAMMSLCVRYISDRENARDILQDGFVKVFTKINNYSGTGSFEGWLRRIFVTTALEFLRSRKNISLNTTIDLYENIIETHDDSVIDKLSVNDLLKCISELPDGFRTVFNLYAIEGYSHQEIAEILQVKESTSRSQFGRARQLLQEKVQILTMHNNNAGQKR